MQAAIDAMCAEGQGIWTFGLYHQSGFTALDAAARAGDLGAAGLLTSFRTYFSNIEARRIDDPAGCLTCGQTFDGDIGSPLPAALATLGPEAPDSQCRFSGVCATCCRRLDLKAAIVAAFRSSLPDLRIIDIGQSGHA